MNLSPTWLDICDNLIEWIEKSKAIIKEVLKSQTFYSGIVARQVWPSTSTFDTEQGADGATDQGLQRNILIHNF